MIRTKSEYEDTVVKFLNLIIDGSFPSKEFFPECSDKDFDEIFFQCVTDGFVIGYSVCRAASGDPIGQRTGAPYVTIKGLSYIDSVKQARALDIAKEAEKKSISAKIRANASIAISILALMATLLINADKIVHNAQKILSYLNSL